MVFLLQPYNTPSTGIVVIRNTGKYVSLLIVESIFGLIVALSNILIIMVLALGWRKLFKNHFYIVLANLIVFSSLKGFVELAFILPYYILQNSKNQQFGYFSTLYEKLIFNISVLADYGVLFFSVLIAINRYLAVTKFSIGRESPGVRTLISCGIVWMGAAVIPILYFFLDCQYTYDNWNKYYFNKCNNLNEDVLVAMFQCLIYLSYVCSIFVLIIYCALFKALSRQRKKSLWSEKRESNRPNTQKKLLKQSVVVFSLYVASTLSVFILSFVHAKDNGQVFDLAYVENLLNLSIAAVYPICFLAMSGDMRAIILSRVTPRSSNRISSFGPNA